ncbi:MAG: hypothetical protein Q4A64_05425 [Porphyromonadaceae bacterium]|nr:hypothetical protein [Porphyromonadaceae bacterium]
MKKYLLTTLVATLMASTLHAEGDTPKVMKLVLHSSSGGELESVALQDIRRVSFEQDNLVIQQHDGKTVSKPLASVHKMFFEMREGVGIQPLLEGRTLSLAYSEEGVSILGLPEEQGFPLLIFGLDGRLVYQTPYYRNRGTIPTAGFSSGIYLIRINNRTLKFNKL